MAPAGCGCIPSLKSSSGLEFQKGILWNFCHSQQDIKTCKRLVEWVIACIPQILDVIISRNIARAAPGILVTAFQSSDVEKFKSIRVTMVIPRKHK